ncbi:9437_t:CDS:2 [Diversispora eburnea]|uniref:9437_t:CDS:1 n=1 Tax=Diversispora eburnea TaxID=1213867 RepID=A0A9N9AFX4_9GLOM|nr:9437_t:CDS:2 [Diversispora eburnea]
MKKIIHNNKENNNNNKENRNNNKENRNNNKENNNKENKNVNKVSTNKGQKQAQQTRYSIFAGDKYDLHRPIVSRVYKDESQLKNLWFDIPKGWSLFQTLGKRKAIHAYSEEKEAKKTKLVVKDEKSGYCANCGLFYDCLESHRQTTIHEQFSNNGNNFKELDEVLKEFIKLKRRRN